jgi:hypothetical protein
MQQMATPGFDSSTNSTVAANRSATRFTQQFAVGAAIFYTLVFVAAVITAPELVGHLVAWLLWITVMGSAAITYAAGRHMSSRSNRSL